MKQQLSDNVQGASNMRGSGGRCNVESRSSAAVHDSALLATSLATDGDAWHVSFVLSSLGSLTHQQAAVLKFLNAPYFSYFRGRPSVWQVAHTIPRAEILMST